MRSESLVLLQRPARYLSFAYVMCALYATRKGYTYTYTPMMYRSFFILRLISSDSLRLLHEGRDRKFLAGEKLQRCAIRMGGVKIDLLIAHVLLVIHKEIERVNAQRTDMFVHMEKKKKKKSFYGHSTR